MLFHLRMPPPGGIAESRRDKGCIRNDSREKLVRTAALLSFRRSAAIEKSFHCNIPATYNIIMGPPLNVISSSNAPPGGIA